MSVEANEVAACKWRAPYPVSAQGDVGSLASSGPILFSAIGVPKLQMRWRMLIIAKIIRSALFHWCFDFGFPFIELAFGRRRCHLDDAARRISP
jgi:hypothetical protein